MEKIAIVGCGLIGRAWTQVFARAGHPVAIYDQDASAVVRALPLIETGLRDFQEAGLLAESAGAVRARVSAAGSLGAALAGAAYVQENVLETVEAKRAVFAALDAAAAPETILASSTSTVPASSFTEELKGRQRCLVAHPVNPPHLVPLVELVPAPWTAPEVVAEARRLLASAGQVPIVVRREIPGFILNRLQAVLLNEAFRLVDEGYVAAEDIDKCVRDGLGLRWSFMGPFETIDLNARDGVSDYARRYGTLLYEMTKDAPRPWSPRAIQAIDAERRQALPGQEREARHVWRDRRLLKLLAHKRAAEKELPA